jgi:hypothetical protein
MEMLMSLSPDEAADALREIAAVETRSRRVYGYRQASPHLILWGVLWMVGYGLTAVWPFRATPIWIATVAIGLGNGFLIELSNAARRGAAEAASGSDAMRQRRAFPAIAVATLVFIAGTIAVMAPVSGKQIGAFIPLVIAFGYVLRGIWGGLRYVVAGIAIAVLVLAGFFLLPAYFPLWMAVVGGGALILAGCWFRGV